jgi:hypothetical protein
MSNMNKTSQLICAHSGLAFAVLMGIGIFAIAGWLPVHQPGWTAEEIVRIFSEDRVRIRIGISVLALCSVLWWSFAAVVATQMKRIEGPHHPLAYTQLACAAGTVLAVLLPSYVWLAMAFRPDAPAPETMQLLNDLAWLSFVGMYPPALLQNIVIGACVLSDRRKDPVFPRWIGFVNFWIAICYTVGALIPFFKTGPFAWNGLFGFWVAAVCFFGWIGLMWWATARAVRRQTSDVPVG